MDQNKQKSIASFGAAFILEQVQQMEDQVNGVLTADDIEYVHRMRVASRRLRTALQLFKGYLPGDHAELWRHEIKAITRSLGSARDLDIQIELIEEKYRTLCEKIFQPGYKRLLLRLKQKRRDAQQKINLAIQRLQENQTVDSMRTFLERASVDQNQDTPALLGFASGRIHRALTDFLSYQGYIHMPDNSEKLHAMRIAGKHLRYTLELFTPLYGDSLTPFIKIMKNIQDQLGEIHDCDVWVAWLPEFLTQEQSRMMDYFGHTKPLKRLLPGIQHLVEDRKFRRQENYKSFLANWQGIKDENTWEKLQALLESSSNQPLHSTR